MWEGEGRGIMKRRVDIMGRNRNVTKGSEGKDQSRKGRGTIRGDRGKMGEEVQGEVMNAEFVEG